MKKLLAAPGAELVVSGWEWAAFIGAVTIFILVDLFVLNRKHEKPSLLKAALQTAIWAAMGVVVGVLIWLRHGEAAGGDYYSGWLIEYSLSVDNVFVWGVVFAFFQVPQAYRHRVLFWGIFGALVMRFLFIFAGVELIQRFSWVILVLALVLMWSAWKLATSDDEDMDISKTRSYQVISQLLKVAPGQHGAKFFVRVDGRLMATYLALCLAMVEVTDLIFAVDSVPAILAITQVAFIVFASNAMAILGLRSLYFLFDAIKDLVTRLNEGLAIILAGVAVKMVMESDLSVFGWFSLPGIHIPTKWSLGFIGLVIAGSIVASWLWPEKKPKEKEATPV